MYGWCGPSKTTSAGPELHQPPEVEHRDAVGEVADDAEVVRDEEVGDVLARLQLDEQVEDRRLHRHVERRRRLVADDEARRSRRTRARSRRAASSPPESWRRARAEVALGEADVGGQREQALLGRWPGEAGELLQRAAARMRAYRVAAVERRVGVLEDDLQLRARPPACAARAPGSVRPSSSMRPRLGSMMPSSVRAKVVLPAARLADEAERLARPERRDTSVQRVDVVARWRNIFARSSMRISGVGRALERAATARDRRTTSAAARCACSWKWQRLACTSVTWCRRRLVARRRSSCAIAQRAANTQPGRSSPIEGQEARDACRAGRDPCARRARGMQRISPTRVGMARVVQHLLRPGPPRPAGRRRARRRARTSSRSRRGCG